MDKQVSFDSYSTSRAMQESSEVNSNSTEIVFEFLPCIRVFKDGHVHRFHAADFVPPSQGPEDKVLSKDILISSEKDLSVRIFMPKNHDNQKLPLLIYIHGGAFCVQSPFSSKYHSYVNNLVDQANVVAVSVEYRLAPEHPIPACYEDSWSALKWVVSNFEKSSNQEPWLRDHADFSRMFLAGDSAGANIAHDVMVRASLEGNELVQKGVNLVGMALIHPFFGGGQNGNAEKLWTFFCKDLPGGLTRLPLSPQLDAERGLRHSMEKSQYAVSRLKKSHNMQFQGQRMNSGVDDPRWNPGLDLDLLQKLVCERILICIAEKDSLRQRGWEYYAAIKKSGWGGEVEIEETEGEDHVFHLKNPGSDNAGFLMKKMVAFLK